MLRPALFPQVRLLTHGVYLDFVHQSRVFRGCFSKLVVNRFWLYGCCQVGIPDAPPV